MVDWDKGEKGTKSALKAITSPAAIIKIGGRCTHPVVANCFSVIILWNCYKYDAQPNHDQLLLQSNHQKLLTIVEEMKFEVPQRSLL